MGVDGEIFEYYSLFVYYSLIGLKRFFVYILVIFLVRWFVVEIEMKKIYLVMYRVFVLFCFVFLFFSRVWRYYRWGLGVLGSLVFVFYYVRVKNERILDDDRVIFLGY